MPQLLTLSKAARLVGVKRNTLQQKIRAGELSTFEGLLYISELLRVYPRTQVEDSSMLEHVNEIKRKATSKLVDESGKFSAPGTFVRKLDALQERLFAELENNQNLIRLLKLIDRKLQDSESDTDTATSLKQILSEFLNQPSPQDINLHSLLNHLPLEVFTNYARLAKSGHEFSLDVNETILEAALRSGLSIPYGCNDGSCGKCKCKVNTGLTRQVRHQSHRLSEDELKQGYILPCAWTSITDIELDVLVAETADEIQQQSIECHIKIVDEQQDLLIVTLKMPLSQRLRFLAGQHIEISLANNLTAVFPIASCPCEQGTLQIHINNTHGSFQDYFVNSANRHLPILVNGPIGNNILNLRSGNPIIFIASHQYFSYIKGLIEQAMALEISEQIELYWINDNQNQSHFENHYRAWDDAIDNFSYHPIQIESPDSTKAIIPALEQIEFTIKHLPNHDYYCCLDSQYMDNVSEFLLSRGVPAAQMHLIKPN